MPAKRLLSNCGPRNQCLLSFCISSHGGGTLAFFYDGTNGNDVYYTRNYTLETDADGKPFENSDVYYGYDGNDAYRIRASNVDLPGAFETSSTIVAGRGDDSLVFAPSKDYRGQVDVQFSGESGTDSVKLDLSKLGSVSIDFTDLRNDSYTTIVAMTHADGVSAGHFFILSDVERIDIIGSGSADILIGNRGDDYLDGGAGADTFYETEGNDQYVFDIPDDVVARYGGSLADVPTGGTDTIRTTVSVDLRQQFGVENLRLQAGDIDGVGNELANLITGSTGSNRIAGGAGNDSLYGKGGADTFVFAEIGTANGDSIWDFSSDDRIELSGAAFTGLQVTETGVLAAGDFVVGYRATAGHAQVIYNKGTGVLAYDADGIGAQTAQDIAFIGKNLTLMNNSHVLLA